MTKLFKKCSKIFLQICEKKNYFETLSSKDPLSMYKIPFLTQSPLSANVLIFENWGRAPAYVFIRECPEEWNWKAAYRQGLKWGGTSGPIALKIWWGPPECSDQGPKWPLKILAHINTWCRPIKDIRKTKSGPAKNLGPSVFLIPGAQKALKTFGLFQSLHIGNYCNVNDMNLMNLYAVLLCWVFK